jgi:hypothetical protein
LTAQAASRAYGGEHAAYVMGYLGLVMGHAVVGGSANADGSPHPMCPRGRMRQRNSDIAPKFASMRRAMTGGMFRQVDRARLRAHWSCHTPGRWRLRTAMMSAGGFIWPKKHDALALSDGAVIYGLGHAVVGGSANADGSPHPMYPRGRMRQRNSDIAPKFASMRRAMTGGMFRQVDRARLVAHWSCHTPGRSRLRTRRSDSWPPRD